MKIVTTISQKGGVGKTTTAHALGAGLFLLKAQRVLLVDLCGQCNLSYTMRYRQEQGGFSSLDVLTRTADARAAIIHTDAGDLIPAAPSLVSADMLITETGKEHRLKEALQPLKKDYDYIILDTPPALGIRTVNALTAADTVIIPTQADTYSLQGIGQLYETIRAVKKYLNKRLQIDGILVTRYNARTIFTGDMLDLLQITAQQLQTKVYKTRIRESVSIKEAQNRQQPIYTYNHRSNGAKDYTAFIEEFLQGMK